MTGRYEIVSQFAILELHVVILLYKLVANVQALVVMKVGLALLLVVLECIHIMMCTELCSMPGRQPWQTIMWMVDVVIRRTVNK